MTKMSKIHMCNQANYYLNTMYNNCHCLYVKCIIFITERRTKEEECCKGRGVVIIVSEINEEVSDSTALPEGKSLKGTRKVMGTEDKTYHY